MLYLNLNFKLYQTEKKVPYLHWPLPEQTRLWPAARHRSLDIPSWEGQFVSVNYKTVCIQFYKLFNQRGQGHREVSPQKTTKAWVLWASLFCIYLLNGWSVCPLPIEWVVPVPPTCWMGGPCATYLLNGWPLCHLPVEWVAPVRLPVKWVVPVPPLLNGWPLCRIPVEWMVPVPPTC